MKTRNILLIATITLLLSGCVVYSFYPLYTDSDLFENDLLLGEWFEDDDNDVVFSGSDDSWIFTHPFLGDKNDGIRDKKRYVLRLTSNEDGVVKESKFEVHVIKLADEYFLDFYIDDYGDDDNITLVDLHLVPVHTFAKLSVSDDKLEIRWFDPEWLEDLIKENKIRIHHEDNGDYILLTAKPKELQKFVSKYVDSEEAFEDGLSVELFRRK
ncbi:hypothetical protein SAMN05444285_11353 [Draconibacterium orientale]|uniref:Lipoprotein n=1 Tax=Draconibacterium orientale TaxID=1168034 RepID=A0A1I0EJV5_9BACT|nr:hypothetical protein [Draconibacterium orientale]SET44776.1 hypothetical protein SAMN05444285_11353 [Draconibacterium orientale]